MNLRSLLAVAAVAAASLPAHAVTVTQWSFEALDSTYSSSTFSGFAASMGTGTASGVHATTTAATFTSPGGNGSARAISANNWAANDYWQFSVSTTGFSGVSLTFDQAGSSTGPADFALQYSVGGSAFTTFASYSLTASTFNSGTASTAVGRSFDLTGVAALNNAPSVVFRLVNTSAVSIGGGSVGNNGTDRIDNFTVSAVSAVPEPESYAMMFAGLGIVGFIARRRKA